MGLFDKKFCAICGDKIGLLGNHKAADGNVCGKCAGKLSPFFTGMSSSTIQQVKEQLAYRENNRQQLNVFSPTKVMGHDTKVYVDANHNCFVVSKRSDYKSANADIINFSTVIGVTSEVKEHKTELFRKDAEGHNQPFNPRKYKYAYEIDVIISLNFPYFNKIKFEVTKDRPESKTSPEFIKFQNDADEIVAVLSGRPQPQMNAAGGVGGLVGAIGQAAMGAAGLAGLAGVGAALLGNQNAQPGMNGVQQGYAQPGMNGVQQGYAQPGMNGVQQGYAQQGMNGVQQGYAQQGMNGVQQGYAQQGINGVQQGYAQQGMNGVQQGYAQQGVNGVQGLGNQGFTQPNFSSAQGFGGTWVCQNCGTANSGNFCQGCGAQRM